MMEQKNKKSKILRFIICAGVLVVAIALAFIFKVIDFKNMGEINFNYKTLLKLIVMIAGVLAAETLIVFILSLPNPENHRARSILSIVSSLMKYVAAVVILVAGLTILGVNVSTIVASVGIVALVVGFSAESLIADVVTGAFMLFENQYNVGDIVEIGGFRGTVSNIGIRTTSITDVGGNVKIINNSAMKNVLNRSDRTSRSGSEIVVPYGTDFEKLESEIPALLERIYAAHPDMMKSVPVYLGIQTLADSGVVMKFVVEVEEKNIFAGSRTLNHDLLLGFKKLGVECPFPQVDVHNIPTH